MYILEFPKWGITLDWAQDMTPSCGLHSCAVDLSSRSVDKRRNPDRDS